MQVFLHYTGHFAEKAFVVKAFDHIGLDHYNVFNRNNDLAVHSLALSKHHINFLTETSVQHALPL